MSRVLLDTHAVLWANAGAKQLSAAARHHIQRCECLFSCASILELAIKHSLGKLRFPNDLAVRDYVDLAVQKLRLTVLPIQVAESCLLALLPYHHNDPFDRILIAQAKVNNLPVISRDTRFDSYGIERLW